MNIEQNFLQSLEWEKFQNELGHETFRVGEGLFIVHRLPVVGKYAYSPRGPRVSDQQETGEKQQAEWTAIIQEAKNRGCRWIRIEPNFSEDLQRISNLLADRQLSLVAAPRDVQPREILVMDIVRSEEEMLSAMKPKTRYNIRLAEKKGVQIVVSKEQKYRDQFFELVQTTALRAGIRSHQKEHYEKMLESLGETVQLYNAVYEGQVIAANLMIFMGDGAIYLHGGSDNEHRNVMAPFLLQWQAICDAKEKGCKWYDFGGVAISNEHDGAKEQKHLEWAGITKFKQGFCLGTESIKFSGTYDVILDPLHYGLYRVISNIRKVI